MKQPDDVVYLHHVLDAIAKVDRYLTNVDKERFLQDTLIQDGVDLETVYATGINDLRSLEAQVRVILRELTGG